MCRCGSLCGIFCSLLLKEYVTISRSINWRVGNQKLFTISIIFLEVNLRVSNTSFQDESRAKKYASSRETTIENCRKIIISFVYSTVSCMRYRKRLAINLWACKLKLYFISGVRMKGTLTHYNWCVKAHYRWTFCLLSVNTKQRENRWYFHESQWKWENKRKNWRKLRVTLANLPMNHLWVSNVQQDKNNCFFAAQRI